MKLIACALLVAVFVRFGAVHTMASASGFTPQAIDYIAGGFFVMVLAAVIIQLTRTHAVSLWRSLILLGASITIVEGAQVAGCRLAITDIRMVPRGTNLCDYVAGFPIGYALFTFYLVLACYILGRGAR